MTPNQLLLFQLICLIAALWATTSIWVRTSRSALQAASRAALTTILPVLGLSVAGFIFYGFQAWPYWVVNALAMAVALVVERRLRRAVPEGERIHA